MPRVATRSPSSPPATRVVVIGAGLAGLVAAFRLQRADVDVIVLEARDRVGGRLYSIADGFAAGQHADLGGELVDGSYRLVPRLCEEMGVGLTAPVSYLHDDVTPDEEPFEGLLAPGRYAVGDQLLDGEAFEAVRSEIHAAVASVPPVLHEVVEQWIRRARLSGTAASVVRAAARMPTAIDPWEIDGHYLTKTWMGATVRRIRGGSDALPKALASHLDVRLGTEVAAVRQRSGQVQVETVSGEVFLADRVVVAVPPMVAPTIGFEPTLPESQATVAGAWRPGAGGKVVAQYEEGDAIRAAFTRVIYSDGPVNSVWVGDTDVSTGPAVLAGFVLGPERGLLDHPPLALAELDRLVETVIGRPPTRIAAAVKNWAPDPLTLAIAVTPASPRWGSSIARAARPHGRVHIAGDHTDDVYCSCMEGAARSGERAADEILSLPPRIHINDIEERMVIR